MPPSLRLHAVVATLGLFTFATAPLRADGLADARTALAAGDFGAMRTALDPFILANPSSDDARVLRAIARIGVAAEDNFPRFLREKLGANIADLDLTTTTLALRFPRQAAYFNAPALTSASPAEIRHDPALNLYETGGAQPTVSFENQGDTPYSLTLVASQSGRVALDFDTTLYLDGVTLGFANALGGFPFDLFIPSAFEIGGDIPEPFDLDGSVPDYYLGAGPVDNSFTVLLPPKSNLSIGLQYSAGGLVLTPTETLPATVKVLNGRVGGINPPRLAPKANFSDFVQFAVELDDDVLTPAVADLEAVSTELELTLSAEETGFAGDLVIGYPDVQLLLAELKFAQSLRQLSSSYRLTQPITVALFEGDFFTSLTKNPSFLTPQGATPTRTAERARAGVLLGEVPQHYAAASEAGLWSRPAPFSGAYLFSIPEDESAEARESLKETVDAFFQFLADAITDAAPFPVGEAEDSTFSLAPVFGAPAVNFRKTLPVVTDEGIVRGTSTELLTRGFLNQVGTANWEMFLADSDLLDLVTPASQSAPKIQRQPAALTSVEEGEAAMLSVIAECYPAPTYQWYRGSGAKAVPIEGATGPSLSFESVGRDDAGVYTVRVTNTRQLARATTVTVTSIPARLYVTYPPEIVTPPTPVVRYAGRSVTLTVGAVGVPAPSYQWFLGDVALTPVRTTPAYTFAASTARAGDYRVVITNSRGEVTSEPVTVEVQTKPVFTLQPVGQTVRVGDSVTFTAAATGNPAPALKWQKNGRDIPGATGPSYTIPSITTADRATYTAVAFSTVNTTATATLVASTKSAAARLVVNP